MKKNKKGFTLVEIMIVVAIIGLLAAIGIPSFQKARQSSREKACINNLRQIESAKEQWAMEMNKVDGDILVAAEVGAYIKGGLVACTTCPSSGAVVPGAVGEATKASCTIAGHTL